MKIIMSVTFSELKAMLTISLTIIFLSSQTSRPKALLNFQVSTSLIGTRNSSLIETLKVMRLQAMFYILTKDNHFSYK